MKCAIVLLPLLMAATAAADTLEVMSSAEICGSCHRAIHSVWKPAAHAAAMESRLFQDAL